LIDMDTPIQNQPNGNQFTDAVLKLIRLEIGGSLTSAQLNWTLEALKRFILPEYFRSGEPQDDADLAIQAQIVASDIEEAWSGLTGAEKWAWVLRRAYLTRLQPLYETASALAKAKAGRATISDADARQAKNTLEALQKITERMQVVAPGTWRELAEIISEIQVNCKYTLGQGGGISLEMAHFLSNQKAA
jgi:hypothetical protein